MSFTFEDRLRSAEKLDSNLEDFVARPHFNGEVEREVGATRRERDGGVFCRVSGRSNEHDPHAIVVDAEVGQMLRDLKRSGREDRVERDAPRQAPVWAERRLLYRHRWRVGTRRDADGDQEGGKGSKREAQEGPGGKEQREPDERFVLERNAGRT